MSSRTSKYAVPFNTRKSSVLDNVVSKELNGGIGYLRVEIPIIPSTDNSIGFKISVYKTPYKESSIPIFEGVFSGSSSDGFRWTYVSSDQNESYEIHNQKVIFCSKKVNEKYYLKYILIGDKITDWGSDNLYVRIDYLSATLETNPDGEGLLEKSVKTASITEYSSLSENNIDGWNFLIDDSTPPISEINATILPKETKSSSDKITLTGVVYGTSIEDETGIVIPTKFSNNQINLGEGKIIADGSELKNLSKNKELLLYIPESAGKFSSKITLNSSTSSDINLSFSFDGSEKIVTKDVTIKKINVGDWSIANRSKLVRPKTTNDINVIKSIPLSSEENTNGEIGSLVNSDIQELFIGYNGVSKLVGKVDIIDGTDVIPDSYKIDGKAILHNGKFKVYNESDEEWRSLTADISNLDASLDDLIDGTEYKKVKSDSILDGYVSRIVDNTGRSLTGTELRDHLSDSDIHVTQEEKDKWNSTSPLNTYTKSELDNRFNQINVNLDDKFNLSLHKSVEIVVDSLPTSHSYKEGTRILSKGTDGRTPCIAISGGPNNWKLTEDFLDGDTVMYIGDEDKVNQYSEYINKNGIIEIYDSGGKISNPDILNNYISKTVESEKLMVDSWSLLSNSYNNIISVSTDKTLGRVSIQIGGANESNVDINNIIFNSSNRPRWGENEIALKNDITDSSNIYAPLYHIHRNHEPVIGFTNSTPSNPEIDERWIINNRPSIYKEGHGWVPDKVSVGDIIYVVNEKAMYQCSRLDESGTPVWERTLGMAMIYGKDSPQDNPEIAEKLDEGSYYIYTDNPIK
jgi:hypothetical protein